MDETVAVSQTEEDESRVPRIVLVVDDELTVVRLCQRILERENYQVITATSPSQGLAILERQRIDVLLADIRMPQLNGLQLVTLARRRQPDITAVIMTGYGTLESAIDALQHGADGLVLKPFQKAELLEKIQIAIKESQVKRTLLRLQTLRPLFEISEALFLEKDKEQLQHLITTIAGQHMECDYAGLYRWDEIENQVYLMNSEGSLADLSSTNGQAEPETSDPFLKELQRAFNTNGLLINRGEPDFHEWKEVFDRYHLDSLLCIPVCRASLNIALLAVRGTNKPFFSEIDREIFLVLARQAALALENANLYADLRESMQRLERSHHAMIQAERLAAAGRLTASIAHEINNPLQGVYNSLQLARRPSTTDKEQAKYLEMAQNQLENLVSLVQRMLDYYRPVARDRKLTDINALVSRVLELLAPQLDEGVIQVHTLIGDHLPSLLVVPNQIQQVLFNIVINAMESMQHGGNLWVETKLIEEAGDQKQINRSIVILVQDSGPGVPADQKERLFEPLESTKEDGTGLGLAVSYGIIMAHGGTLALIDAPEREPPARGACFYIALPATSDPFDSWGV